MNKLHVDVLKASRDTLAQGHKGLLAIYETESRRYNVASDSFKMSEIGKFRQSRNELLLLAVSNANIAMVHVNKYLELIGEV